ncbi:MAG: hypothetical protein KDK65_01070 [Chlamydiia bacterium]|nr:hypothetical protein [Chlamydiia bacterium]
MAKLKVKALQGNFDGLPADQCIDQLIQMDCRLFKRYKFSLDPPSPFTQKYLWHYLLNFASHGNPEKVEQCLNLTHEYPSLRLQLLTNPSIEEYFPKTFSQNKAFALLLRASFRVQDFELLQKILSHWERVMGTESKDKMTITADTFTITISQKSIVGKIPFLESKCHFTKNSEQWKLSSLPLYTPFDDPLLFDCLLYALTGNYFHSDHRQDRLFEYLDFLQIPIPELNDQSGYYWLYAIGQEALRAPAHQELAKLSCETAQMGQHLSVLHNHLNLVQSAAKDGAIQIFL